VSQIEINNEKKAGTASARAQLRKCETIIGTGLGFGKAAVIFAQEEMSDVGN
jgi:hypothetical protein